jgi:AraC-like DNA-binding protein
MNNELLYHYTLFTCAVIYIFNGLFLMLSKVPRQRLYRAYRLSRQLLGVSMLMLGAGNLVNSITLQHHSHLLRSVAFNMIIYYIVCVLMSYAMMNLFQHGYIHRRRVLVDLIGTAFAVAFSVASILVSSLPLTIGLLGCMVWLILTFIIHFIIKFNRAYRYARQEMVNYSSRRLHHFAIWISRSNLLLVILGLLALPMAFTPLLVNMIFVLVACIVFIYVFFSYQNYLYYFGDIEKAIMVTEIHQPLQKVDKDARPESQLLTDESRQRFQQWLAQKKYLQQDLSIEHLATVLGTNRSYLSLFINRKYHHSFSDWVNRLRIHDAKLLLVNKPNAPMEEIAISVGFSSGSYFTKIFNKIEGVTPTRWREMIKSRDEETTEH